MTYIQIFGESYYHLKSNEPLLPSEFSPIATMVDIDCSRQLEIVHPGSISLNVEFGTQYATIS